MATATTHMRHPFAPLTPEELEEAVAIVRANQAGSEHIRFVMSRLHEPPPEIALSYQPGDGVPREVFFSLLDKTPGLSGAYEAIVNLTDGKVTSWKRVEGQPSIILEEFFAAEDTWTGCASIHGLRATTATPMRIRGVYCAPPSTTYSTQETLRRTPTRTRSPVCTRYWT